MNFINGLLVVLLVLLFFMMVKAILAFFSRFQTPRYIVLLLYNIFDIPYTVIHKFNDILREKGIGDVPSFGKLIDDYADYYEAQKDLRKEIAAQQPSQISV